MPKASFKALSALALLLALGAPAAAQQAVTQYGVRYLPKATKPTNCTAGKPCEWSDNAATPNLRYWDGTSNNYTAACVPTISGDVCAWNGTRFVRAPAGGGGGYVSVADEGTPLAAQTTLNFTGAGVSCVDNGGASRTDCTIAGGGSTGNWTFTGDAADDSGAAVLTIGATTATGVTIGRTAGANILAADTTVASGKTITGAAASDLYLNAVTGQLVRLRVNGSNMLSVSSTAATFAVPLVMTGTQTGTYTLGGTPTIAAPIVSGGLTASGSAANNFSASTGTFLTSTGANTLSGNVVISGSKTFTSGTGLNYFNGQVSAAANLRLGDGGSAGGLIFPSNDAVFDIGQVTTGRFRNLYLSDVAYVDSGVIAPSLLTSDTSALELGVDSLTRLYLGTTADVASATLTGRNNTWGSTTSITGYSGVRVEAPTLTVTDGVVTSPHLATLSVSDAPTITEVNDGVFSSTSLPYAFWVQAGGAAFTREDTAATVGTAGITLDNTTDATAGNQKYSPALIWSGNGWKTTATAGSQSVRYAAQLVPIEGTANPDGALIFYKSINGGAYAQANINGHGYFGGNDAQALGTATTSSTSFVDVGNGSSTGFASWTAPTTLVTKTYAMRIVVRSYMPTLGSSVTTYFQVLQDGVAISGQPTATSSQAFGTTSQYLQTSWSIAVPCTAGSSHVYKLQWKVGNGSDSAGVTATAGTLQYFIEG